MVEARQESGDNTSINGTSFVVLINSELQYSIWPSGKAHPAGWFPVGQAGSKADCLAFIEAHWTDLRPLHVRENESRA